MSIIIVNQNKTQPISNLVLNYDSDKIDVWWKVQLALNGE